MDINSIIQTITVYAIPLILAITIHEAAHGYVARYFGDQTAWMLGRVTLNPMKHIDPVGTILVPAVMLLGSAVSGLGGDCFWLGKACSRQFQKPAQSQTGNDLGGSCRARSQSSTGHYLGHPS